MTSPQQNKIVLTVPSPSAEEEDAAPQRLDKFLALHCDGISRSRLKSLITEGQVSLTADAHNTVTSPRTITDPSAKVKPGDQLLVTLPENVDPTPKGQDIPLTVVYEDDQVIVIDKPAGMVVHPAPGNEDGTLVNALIAHCGDSLSGINGVRRPGIVHRIDKDTSGLIIAAKTDQAHASLAKQFAEHSLERAYQALVWGCPIPAEGTIDKNIGRSRHNRLKMTVVSSGGKHAITHYRLLRRLDTARQVSQSRQKLDKLAPVISLVECRLETGRTHQVRVHMDHIGYPLIGDPFYGRKRISVKGFKPKLQEQLKAFNRQALHAYVIGFDHPVTQERLIFRSPLPSDMKAILRSFEEL
ncbi:MAG: RNA pseudouridine synthase [Kordiimonas sp.]|nr:RNA pseudouridine synthase [Kordiimonas sp.]|tara:strand:- start:4784 stop:5851 length:1068 start_codon:yes stop_codon:yes gene_type:complete